jgi:hypothetical protein
LPSNLEGRDHSDDQIADGGIILQWILETRMGSFGIDSSHSGRGIVADFCESGNEP